ncbi:GTP cyclohydrolase FolE2 [Atopomonas sediminilitoris]|uniref:GTP cyclohydrolase FolE2 n=1 Tax=Atopomonas sediminilitoris TaxID=2919919 RepID=UPI001F4D3ED7|nr:GTP cyclohydrolase FolE2 [Atopomonas sediminilitoris]MCJ8169455.1 GTP cyclohydrolase FolE2 [Atopomonas sediminilitoris]
MTAALPDIAAQLHPHAQPLDWVGMQGIALPIQLLGQTLAAKVDAGVSLDSPDVRGIHMSRLYLALELLSRRELSVPTLRTVLQQFLDEHAGMAQRAFIRLHGELLIRRPALVSQLSGWRAYPISLAAELGPIGLQLSLTLEVSYSSTCPCSAALARQLIQEQFAGDFAGKRLDHAAISDWLGSAEGIVATPHSQRSTATLQLQLNPTLEHLPIQALLDSAEAALGTALQTAVKRADEQAFALANGQNLMFCEDAARRLHNALENHPALQGFALTVVHAESLHAHDAVARSRWQRAS